MTLGANGSATTPVMRPVTLPRLFVCPLAMGAGAVEYQFSWLLVVSVEAVARPCPCRMSGSPEIVMLPRRVQGGTDGHHQVPPPLWRPGC